MCKGLRVSIAQLREMAPPGALDAKFALHTSVLRCLVRDKPIRPNERVFAALVSVGKLIMFRLIRVVAEQEIRLFTQQILIVEDKAMLKRALEMVLENGVMMGEEGDVCSRVFFERDTPRAPVLLTPPKRFPLITRLPRKPSNSTVQAKEFKLEKLARR